MVLEPPAGDAPDAEGARPTSPWVPRDQQSLSRRCNSLAIELSSCVVFLAGRARFVWNPRRKVSPYIADMELPSLAEWGRGWLRYLERKLSLPNDDWSRSGTPSAAWDNKSGAPTTSWYRFDGIGMTLTLALAAKAGTMDRNTAISSLDGICDRLRQYHGFNEWVEQRGPDPRRADYPQGWRGLLMPEELWGSYDCPGWGANGQQEAGFEPNPIEAKGAIYYKGFFNLVLGLRALFAPERDPTQPIDIVCDDHWRFRYSHSQMNAILAQDFAAAVDGKSHGLCCEIDKLWPL